MLFAFFATYLSCFIHAPHAPMQTVGMAKDLVAEVPKAKEMFDRASEILGYDLLKVGDAQLMGDTRNIMTRACWSTPRKCALL